MRRAFAVFFFLTSASLSACSFLTGVGDLTANETSDGGNDARGAGDSEGSRDGNGVSDSSTSLSDSSSPLVDAAPDGDAMMSAEAIYVAAVNADKPLAYTRLEETSGSVAPDVNGKIDGRVDGDFSWGAAGVIGKALTVRKAAINYGSNFDFPGIAPFSLEIWVNITTIDNIFRHIFTKNYEPNNDDTNREEYGIFVVDQGMGDGKQIGFERYANGSQVTVLASFDNKVNRWTHLVATYDGATLRFYIDGTLIGAKTMNALQATKPVDFLVAARDAPFSAPMIGAIDEVAIYDHALPVPRVKAHFAAAPAQ